MDVVITLIVVLVLVGITGAINAKLPASVRRWVWFGLLEYMVCAGVQLVYTRAILGGGDTLLYARTGAQLARLMDENFGLVAPEVVSLLFQQPSLLDQLVYGGGGGNTGSMHGISTLIVFALGGSEYAAQVSVAGLSFFGTLGIFSACRDAYREVPPARILVATSLLPSVAFWTATLHKESFAVMGLGALLLGWRALYNRRWIRALFFGPLGVMLILLFRAPAIAPFTLGLVVYLAVERLQKVRGVEITILGPAYLLFGLVALAVAMVAMTRLAPKFGLEALGGTMATQQQNWAGAAGGSTFAAVDEGAPQSLVGQIVRIPLALLNALLRPQLFDVHNFGALLSALEMTAFTWTIVRAGWNHGVGGAIRRIQRSPFLLMCAVVTFVGCAMVGLVTFNFGSLARYRVPFLPLYGAFLCGFLDRPAAAARRPAIKRGRLPLRVPARLPQPVPVKPAARVVRSR